MIRQQRRKGVPGTFSSVLVLAGSLLVTGCLAVWELTSTRDV